MRIEIKPYLAELAGAVREFNARMRMAGVGFQFPERPESVKLPPRPGRAIHEEYFLATEGDQVRGGYILKCQEFLVAGAKRRLAEMRLPMSEGLVDRRYGIVAIQLLKDALARQPLLLGLGMGGHDEPVAKLLKGAGWYVRAVPFLFKVNRAGRFLRGIRYLRSTPLRRLLLDSLATSGVGWMGVKLAQGVRRRRPEDRGAISADVADEFASWADRIWDRCGKRYALVGVRDQAALSILYPREEGRFIRLRMSRDDEVVGWAVLLDTPMSGHKQFGDLRAGSIADCLAAPEDADAVVDACTRYLEERGVDLIVSNQAHASWCCALARAGFLRGPSNFLVGLSRGLSDLLQPLPLGQGKFHLNRGDGDGPIHL